MTLFLPYSGVSKKQGEYEPAVDIYYSLYGTILNAVTAPKGEKKRESEIAGGVEKESERRGRETGRRGLS